MESTQQHKNTSNNNTIRNESVSDNLLITVVKHILTRRLTLNRTGTTTTSSGSGSSDGSLFLLLALLLQLLSLECGLSQLLWGQVASGVIEGTFGVDLRLEVQQQRITLYTTSNTPTSSETHRKQTNNNAEGELESPSR